MYFSQRSESQARQILNEKKLEKFIEGFKQLTENYINDLIQNQENIDLRYAQQFLNECLGQLALKIHKYGLTRELKEIAEITLIDDELSLVFLEIYWDIPRIIEFIDTVDESLESSLFSNLVIRNEIK